MPALLAPIIAWVMGSFLKQVFYALGVGLISFWAIMPFVRAVIVLVISVFDNISVDVLSILELAGLSTSLSIILSAYSARAYLVASQKVFAGKGGSK